MSEPINIQDAKSQLSALIASIERGDVAEVVIARNGHPKVRVVAYAAGGGVRFGGLPRFALPVQLHGEVGP